MVMRFSHGHVFFDSRNVQKSVTQIIYLGPLPNHHNTTRKVERVNGIIADVPRPFAGERADDWPALVPLAEFAINDSAAPLGTGYTPF